MNNDSFTLPPGSDDSSFADHLIQLSYTIQSVLIEIGSAHDLSLIQVRLLGILRDREPSMQQLAAYLNLDKSSITGLIDRAQRRGFVERIASAEDRRRFNVRLTSEGRQLASDAGAVVVQRIEQLAASLSEKERAQLMHSAVKIQTQSFAE